MRRFARARGIRFIYVDRDDISPLAIIEAVNALRRNEVLALLGDRDGSSHTMELDFFGRPAAIPVGAAYLAMATGAPVIPVFVPLEGGRYTAVMEEPISWGGHARPRTARSAEGPSSFCRVSKATSGDTPTSGTTSSITGANRETGRKRS